MSELLNEFYKLFDAGIERFSDIKDYELECKLTSLYLSLLSPSEQEAALKDSLLFEKGCLYTSLCEAFANLCTDNSARVGRIVMINLKLHFKDTLIDLFNDEFLKYQLSNLEEINHRWRQISDRQMDEICDYNSRYRDSV